MAAQPSSSQEITQEPFNPVLPPVINLSSRATLVNPPNTMDCGRESFEFNTECMIDFESLRANGKDIAHLFMDQGWNNYFEMLNGWIYYDLIRNFWVKAYVFEEEASKEEVRKLIKDKPALKGKSRTQLGLPPFRGTEIRSNLLGMHVVITQAHIAKLLGLDNKGENVYNYKIGKMYKEAIEQDLFKVKGDYGKVVNMKDEFIIAFRIMLASIFTRNGGSDTISWPHRHFIFFLLKKVKINLAACLFDHLCSSITEGHHKKKAVIHHPRLISELLRQTKLVEILKKGCTEKLRMFAPDKFDAQNLLNRKLIKGPVVYPTNPLLEKFESYFFIDGYPVLSEADNDEVIENFLEMFTADTDIPVDRSMVVELPDFAQLNP
jgi:hypothetical protein